jgi:N-hydroxyarylamine O-acetyltransferase
MDINAYFNRIKYSGSRAPTADTLRQLHNAHVRAIPFENLDIHLGRAIVLDNDKFYEKIVNKNRGGFCYELNGLFAALLRALDFNVTMLSARVYNNDILGAEFDHMVLFVQLEERWLADVGYGALFFEPLRMDDRNDQIQRNVIYRIEQNSDIWKLKVQYPGDSWKDFYQFTLIPRQLQDYAEMCRWHQVSPQSWHTQNRICTIPTPDGRITLNGMNLVIRKGKDRTERELKTKKEYVRALKSYFGIDM